MLDALYISAAARCGWVKFRECGMLLYGKRWPLKLKGPVCKRYVRAAILCESEALCLKASDKVIL